ncbi:TetR/AcrR family transcriptional regulator [Amycolatopsis albispora]|uniref:TetR/AcrR family transcriptional regulator n=1 Tax=Amycolatopsis albispora TaxID=1804986 RepID=UPI001F1AF108|nr:TetR/AcrR family transcriptional regulator [Amycolatopsis albispora]
MRVLDAEPDAGVAAVAVAAGVTRQTVYAHFPTREQLLAAVLDHLTEQVVAAMDAADPGTGPAADALVRLLDAARRASGRYPALVRKLGSLPVGQDGDHRRHAPVADRLKEVIERGQGTGEFDDRLSSDWLVAVTISLAHTASAETDAGRMPGEQAAEALRTSLLRVLGARQ